MTIGSCLADQVAPSGSGLAKGARGESARAARTEQRERELAFGQQSSWAGEQGIM